MRAKSIAATFCLWSLLVLGVISIGAGSVQAQALKIEAQLIWGTNDKSSPNPKHTPVEADVEKKLKDLPLKWTHYFVVNRKTFDVAKDANSKVTLSDQCAIEVKDLGKSVIEISHFGKGERVWTGKQSLPKGETLVLGGNAPSSTSWLVVLKRIE